MGDQSEENMRLALLEQKVDNHGTILEKMSTSIEKIGESIHDISLVLQRADGQKDTFDRAFKSIEKHDAQIQEIRERLPVIQLTSDWVKTGVIAVVALLLIGVINMYLK